MTLALMEKKVKEIKDAQTTQLHLGHLGGQAHP